MHVQGQNSIPPFTTPHGEVVRELAGASMGGLQQHSLAHITLPPQKASLKHYHPDAEESYYILSGSAEVEIDGETRRLVAGEMVAIPAAQVHQISNPSDREPVTFIAICVPPWTPDCSIIVED